MSNPLSFAKVLLRFASFRRVPVRVVIITALASFALLMAAIWMGHPLYVIALYALLPWVPLFFFEFLWKYEHYTWMAVFAVIALAQVGHIGEHAVQMAQLVWMHGTLACPPVVDDEANAARAMVYRLRTPDQPATGRSAALIVQPSQAYGLAQVDANGRQVIGPPACGVFGQLDFETVHLVWDTLVWIGALWLLTKFPGNLWLWIAVIAASLHEIEHLFLGWIFFLEPDQVFRFTRQLWATTVEGHLVTAHPAGQVAELATFYDAGGKVGLLGRNGLVEAILGTRNLFPLRPYLHFGYNLLVVAPTVIAFLVQVKRVYDEYLARALPELTEDQLVRAMPKLANLKFAPAAVIVRQGAPADRFYIITRGQVDVVRRQRHRRELVVNRLTRGQAFGEIDLMSGGKHFATVRAASPVEVLALDRETLSALMHESRMSREQLERVVRQQVLRIEALPDRA